MNAAGSTTSLREQLKLPGPSFAAMLTIPDAGVAGILGWSGFDFVVIDCEHGPFSPSSARGCIDALAATPAQAMIRVAANDPVLIKQALDLGAEGILAPTVIDGAAAAAAVEAARYSPQGSRGVGTGHASRYGADLASYLAEANARIAVLATIENAAGVENAEEIARVDGIDGIVVGATDLSADLGLLGVEDDGRLRQAIAHVAEVSIKAGLRVGTGCEPGAIGDLGKLGMTLFVCYSDGSALGASAVEAVGAANASWKS